MFEYFVAVQAPWAEGVVLEAFLRAAHGVSFNRVRASFAYATPGGAQLLDWSMADEGADWPGAHKRWLISFDWGHTDPLALEYLQALPHSEVRIPHAEEVISRRLVPATCFHPKTAVFDSRTRRSSAASLVVASANLTVSGLKTGYENASGAIWTAGRLSTRAREQLSAMRTQTRELDAIWRDAAPLTTDLLRRYRGLRRRRRPDVAEDTSREARTFERRYTEMNFERTAALSAASALWVEVGNYVVENLGRGRPGNQFDLSRGTRVFFGFSGERVPPNTALGPVRFRYGGGSYEHNMRFGDNSMDKLNLPVPVEEGPDEYEGTTLLFERRADNTFEMTVGTAAQIREWKRRSTAQGTLFRMQSGREYGVFSLTS